MDKTVTLTIKINIVKELICYNFLLVIIDLKRIKSIN